MSAPTHAVGSSTARAAAALAAPALVLLEMPGRQGVGFIASPEGGIITNLHVVAGAEEIHVLLSDARFLPVEEVVALDEKRDLAVLRLPTQDIPSLLLAPDTHPGEGDALFILLPTASCQLELRHTRVRAVQVLDESLTFLELETTLPETASGSPVLDATGAWVGVATCAFADGRPVTIVIPSRYALPLLERPGAQPLSALALVRPSASRQRHVPTHSLALLEGCATDAVETVGHALMHAIRLGAPLYNQGDAESCCLVYLRATERLVHERADCPGIQEALREGLRRYAGLEGADARAWALRDTFDGLLLVINRWLQAQAALAFSAAPKLYLQ